MVFRLFLKKALQFIIPTLNSFFNCHSPKRIKLATKLRTGLSHLREHEFKRSFQNFWNPICRCVIYVELCLHFYLHCLLFENKKRILLRTVKNIDSKLLGYSDLRLKQIRLIGDASLDVNINSSILNVTINFDILSKRFEESLFLTFRFIFSTITIFFTRFCSVSFFPLYWYFRAIYLLYLSFSWGFFIYFLVWPRCLKIFMRLDDDCFFKL